MDTDKKSKQGDTTGDASEYSGDPCDLSDFEDLHGTTRLKNGLLGLVVTVNDCSA